MKDIDLLIIEKIRKEQLQKEFEDNRIQLEVPNYYEIYKKIEEKENKETKRVIIIDL
tara:strand:- start:1271 stop:1441 length:171 start_codon:yes stop_codon:yes gene_type:complete